MTLQQGRLKLATRVAEYQKARFDSSRAVRGQCDLMYRNGIFYLAVVDEQPDYKTIFTSSSYLQFY
ncbi:MAG: hypothetical protein WA421_14665 [Nitrososphaeraceae archaeon]